MADNAEYMILGYSLMALILGGMVFSLVWRFRALRRDEQRIAQFEAEDRAERVAPSPDLVRPSPKET